MHDETHVNITSHKNRVATHLCTHPPLQWVTQKHTCTLRLPHLVWSCPASHALHRALGLSDGNTLLAPPTGDVRNDTWHVSQDLATNWYSTIHGTSYQATGYMCMPVKWNAVHLWVDVHIDIQTRHSEVVETSFTGLWLIVNLKANVYLKGNCFTCYALPLPWCVNVQMCKVPCVT